LSKKPVVIFTTAYSDYAIDGYSLGVVEYLLKPISFERFFQAVNKAIEQINLIRKSRNDEPEDYIMLKSEHRIHKVKHNEILYIEGLKEYVIFHLKNEKRIITLRSIKSLEESLPDNFMRIHRSYIINKNEISTLYRNMVEIGKRKIDIGKTYKEKVMNELMKK
jgi:DNA-binding LytR/AlgR family response regulator